MHAEQIVFVGDGNKFLVTGAPSTLVRSEGKVRVSLFTIFTHNLRVIELVLDKKILSVFGTRVDVDFSESVVECGLLNTLIRSGFEPVGKHTELATAFKFIDELRNRAHSD